MRNEIRYKWIIVTLAFLLVIMVVAVQCRLYLAAPYVSLSNVPGASGTISTRDGEVVFDGVNTKYPAFYAVVGNVIDSRSIIHLSHRTLAYRYRDMLAAHELTIWGGLRDFKGLSDCEMQTTLLSGAAHQALYDAFGEYHGCLVAYDYLTGEILALVSVPASQAGSAGDGYLINRVMGTYAPGSTMKIITLICALTQDPALQGFTYTCSASYSLPDGGEIACGSAHGGPLTMSDAIGHSCNCYFAALIAHLDADRTCGILEELGFNTQRAQSKSGSIDRLSYSTGYATFNSATVWEDVWNLIGQGSMVNPLDMARIAGAVVNGGSSADPYIVQSIYNPNEEEFTMQAGQASMTPLVDPVTADTLAGIWSDAMKTYCHTMNANLLDRRITHAKTGTAALPDSATGEIYTNRLLLGVMEEEHVAFMLAVEHLPSDSSHIFTIANTLAQIVGEASR